MANKENQINKEFWQKLWSILKQFQKRMIWLFVIVALFELTRLASPYLLKLVIEHLENFDAEKIKELLLLITLIFASDGLSTVIHYFKDRIIFAFLIDMEYSLPITLQKKLISLSLGYHEKENTGNKIIKVQRGVDKLIDLMVNICWEFIPTIANITFIFIIMCYFNWQVSLIFAFFIPIFLIITYVMNKRVNPMRRSRHEEYENASGILGQSIINIYTVQSFVQELKETKKYTSIRGQIKRIESLEWRIVLNFNVLRGLTIDVGRVAVIFYSAFLAWQGNISLGSLVFFITLSETAYHSLFRISRTYDRLIESSTAVERITKLLDVEETIDNNPKIDLKKELKGSIKFDNISFSYHAKSKTPALKNANLEIKPGETIALVGPSGGGKTTVVKLLYRHYDVTKGGILVDNHDIRDYDIHKYRSNLAIVPQDVEVFNTSLKENIAYGKTNATQAEIEEAARIANIDFIPGLDRGFNTLVGERGVKLSGGQKQRVGIARAVLSKPAILIFDEATSNLDTHSERLIQKSIERISKDQTMIIIAHRLSTIVGADKIFVIDKGRITESGTHEELLKNKDGLYTDLLKLQALGELR
jgi:ABC-type multidrug transport system fused ATPase/permease subunit